MPTKVSVDETRSKAANVTELTKTGGRRSRQYRRDSFPIRRGKQRGKKKIGEKKKDHKEDEQNQVHQNAQVSCAIKRFAFKSKVFVAKSRIVLVCESAAFLFVKPYDIPRVLFAKIMCIVSIHSFLLVNELQVEYFKVGR